MITTTQLVFVAAAVVVAALPALRRQSSERARDVLAAAAVGVSFLIAHVGLVGWPRWGAWEHQPAWIALPALAVTLPFVGLKPQCPGARIIAAAAIAVVVGALVIRPAAAAEWQGAASRWGWLAGLTLGGAIVIEGTSRLAARAPGVTVPAAVGLVSGAAAVLALLSHYATFALLGGALALTLAAHCASLLVRRESRPQQGAVLIATTVSVTLLLGGYLHSLESDRVSGVWFLVAGAAPLLAWIPTIRAARPGSRGQALLNIALVAVTLLLAVLGAVFEANGEQKSDDVSEWEEEWE